MALAAMALVLGIAGGLASADEGDEGEEGPSPAELTAKLREQRKALWESKRYADEPFVRMRDPAPGEWLASFEEDGQTAADLARQQKRARRPRIEGRGTIALLPLQPMGDRASGVMEAVRAHAAIFFGCDATIMTGTAIPKQAWRAERRQHDADAILARVKRLRPASAHLIVALTDRDVYSDDLNFVFGIGSWSERTAVLSFARHDSSRLSVPEPLYLDRGTRLVAHEAGHVLGLDHCVYYECVMNGSNSMEESDAQPSDLCCVCLEKLTLVVPGVDLLARYDALAAWYGARDLPEAAAAAKARAAWLRERKKSTFW